MGLEMAPRGERPELPRVTGLLRMLPKDEDRESRGPLGYAFSLLGSLSLAASLRFISFLTQNQMSIPRKMAPAIPPMTPPATAPALEVEAPVLDDAAEEDEDEVDEEDEEVESAPEDAVAVDAVAAVDEPDEVAVPV